MYVSFFAKILKSFGNESMRESFDLPQPEHTKSERSVMVYMKVQSFTSPRLAVIDQLIENQPLAVETPASAHIGQY